MVPALFGVTHGAVQFMFYEKLKVWKRGGGGGGVDSGEHPNQQPRELSNWDFLTLSAASKTLAGTVTYPYQVVRARLQMFDAGREYASARDVVEKVWRVEGWRGFYKG